MTFLITYIPATPSERNEDLLSRIKKYNVWAILNATNYIIKIKDKKTTDIREDLVEFLHSRDKLMVSELTGNAAWRGFNEDLSAWLKRNL